MTCALGVLDSVVATEDPLVLLSDLFVLMLLILVLLLPAELLVEPAEVGLEMIVELVTGFDLRAVVGLALASSDLTRLGKDLVGLYETSSSFEVLGFFSGGLLGLVVS